MNRDEIERRIHGVFEDAFEIEPERLTPEAKVFEDLGLDSLDIVDLIVALQKQFGVQIREDERVRAIRTLADIADFIETLMQEEDARRSGS